ncbi:hypothetical protein PI126_g24687 [Phytophthora idaei]|nr:hypothetical protein PI126_g24687 [Phytophthora idaei]
MNSIEKNSEKEKKTMFKLLELKQKTKDAQAEELAVDKELYQVRSENNGFKQQLYNVEQQIEKLKEITTDSEKSL